MKSINAFRVLALLCGLLAFGLSSCSQQQRLEYWLNPDGSGKLAFNLKESVIGGLPGLGAGNPKGQSEDERKKQLWSSLENLLDNTDGVRAWSNLRVSLDEDAIGTISGVIYFDDLNALSLPGVERLQWEVHDESRWALSRLAPSPVDDSDEAVEMGADAGAWKWSQRKPLLVSMLTDASFELLLHFPEMEIEPEGWSYRKDDEAWCIRLNGNELIPDILAEEPHFDYLKQSDVSYDEAMVVIKEYELPKDLVVSAPFEIAGYQEALAQAELEQDRHLEIMREEIAKHQSKVLGGVDEDEEGVELVDAHSDEALVQVGEQGRFVIDSEVAPRVLLCSLTGYEVGLNPSWDGDADRSHKNTLGVACLLNWPVVSASVKSIDQVLNLDGKSMFEDREPHGYIVDRDDEAAATVKFKMRLQGLGLEEVLALDVVAGQLEVQVSTGEMQMDLGMMPLEAGSRGAQLDAQIAEVDADGDLKLSLSLNPEQYAGLEVYSEDGNSFPAQAYDRTSMGEQLTIRVYFDSDKPPPASLGFKVALYKGLRKHLVPFRFEGFSPLRQP